MASSVSSRVHLGVDMLLAESHAEAFLTADEDRQLAARSAGLADDGLAISSSGSLRPTGLSTGCGHDAHVDSTPVPGDLRWIFAAERDEAGGPVSTLVRTATAFLLLLAGCALSSNWLVAGSSCASSWPLSNALPPSVSEVGSGETRRPLVDGTSRPGRCGLVVPELDVSRCAL